MRNTLGRVVALAALAFLYPLLRLDAHAILRSAMPASNEVVHGATVHVRLQFSSRIDVKRSRLILPKLPRRTHLPCRTGYRDRSG